MRRRDRRVEAGLATGIGPRAGQGRKTEAGLGGRGRNQVNRRIPRVEAGSPVEEEQPGGAGPWAERGRGGGVAGGRGQPGRAEPAGWVGISRAAVAAPSARCGPALRPCTGAAQRSWGLGSSRSGAAQPAGLRGQREFRAPGKRLCEQHELGVAVRPRGGLDLAVGWGGFFPGARYAPSRSNR